MPRPAAFDLILRDQDPLTGFWYTINPKRRYQVHVYRDAGSRHMIYRFKTEHDFFYFRMGFHEGQKHRANRWGRNGI